jgi:hypothetical protein
MVPNIYFAMETSGVKFLDKRFSTSFVMKVHVFLVLFAIHEKILPLSFFPNKRLQSFI